MPRTIELPEEQVSQLEQLAARDHRSLDEVVQFAVGDYLVRRQTRSEWAKRLEEAVEYIREDIPTDVTPDAIEADIAAARAEVRGPSRGRRLTCERSLTPLSGCRPF